MRNDVIHRYTPRSKIKHPSRTKAVVVGLSASGLLAASVGVVGLPGLMVLPIAWAGAYYATRNPRATPKANPRTTAWVVGSIGVGLGVGLGSLDILPAFSGLGFSAGALLPLLNDEFGRLRSRNTTAKQADIVIVEHRPQRPRMR